MVLNKLVNFNSFHINQAQHTVMLMQQQPPNGYQPHFPGFPNRQQPFLLSHDLNGGPGAQCAPGSAPTTTNSNGGHWISAPNYHNTNNGPQGGATHR